MSEHDFEAIRGVPGHLPAGERILWQGAPRWTALAQQAFHVRAVGAYFGLMFVWRLGSALRAGQTLMSVLQSIVLISPIPLATLAVLAGLAWLYSRTTVYTITNKRVIIRFGLALPKAFNIPLKTVESAASKTLRGGGGDLAMTLKAGNKIAFAHLWPNARPWRLAAPQPTFRALADVSAAAGALAAAMRGEVAIDLTRPAPAPERSLAAPLAQPSVLAA